MKNKLLTLSILLITSILVFSCDTQNPVYGTWADNYGNTITFNKGKTFEFKYKENDIIIKTKGSFVFDLNTIIMKDETNQNAEAILCEWDVRGNILYLTFKSKVKGEIVSHKLALYRIG